MYKLVCCANCILFSGVAFFNPLKYFNENLMLCSPLSGVTALPGMTSPLPTITASSPEPSAFPVVPKEIVKQEITIKEITPVSEIPIITDVKIKEILPSPSIEVAEYSSSKSPLIPREATSEKSTSTEYDTPKPEQEMPSVVEVHSSPETVSTEEINIPTNNKDIDARAPSKISLSTHDSINSEIYSSPIVPIIATMGAPFVTPDVRPVASTTKASVLEEEDQSLFDHNPAFPPLPDDLSVLSNHGDEIVPEPSADSDHMLVELPPTPDVIIASITTSTEAETRESLTTTAKYLPDTSVRTTEKSSEAATEPSTNLEPASTNAPFFRENPTIKLRSAIPTEILVAPSEEVSESKVTNNDAKVTVAEVTHTEEYQHDVATQTSTAVDASKTTPDKFDEITNFEETTTTTKSDEKTTHKPAPFQRVSFITTSAEPEPELQSTTQKDIEMTTQWATEATSNSSPDKTTSSIVKSNVATEVTSQTELSSLPIETSDQNPHESLASENVSKDTLEVLTSDPLTDLSTITDKPAFSSEAISVAKADSRAIENVETTEFILTSFGSSESSTDAIELIKIPGGSDKNAAIIDSTDGNKNALTDLIKLVSDVASMSDHTVAPVSVHQSGSTSFSDSEELIPVNAGYKSKNSNFNQNSITEIPTKSKGVPMNKQKVVEIEDDDSAGITDSLIPNDKVEPTTRRPIIDNVSDDMPEIKTEKKDIEIITQSYVPTFRRPTKVILQDHKSGLSDEIPQDDAPASASSEMVTEGITSRDSNEAVTGSSVELTTAAGAAAAEPANATLGAEQ